MSAGKLTDAQRRCCDLAANDLRCCDVLSVRALNVLHKAFAQTEIDPEYLDGPSLKAGIDRVAAWARLSPQQMLRRTRHCGTRTWLEISLFAGYEVAQPHQCICRTCGRAALAATAKEKP